MGETMGIERAREIVGACVENVLVREGVRTEAAPLAGYTLAEMVEANRIVAAENRAERVHIDGQRTISDRPARSDVECSGCGDEPILVDRANRGRRCARCEERALDVFRRPWEILEEVSHVR